MQLEDLLHRFRAEIRFQQRIVLRRELTIPSVSKYPTLGAQRYILETLSLCPPLRLIVLFHVGCYYRPLPREVYHPKLAPGLVPGQVLFCPVVPLGHFHSVPWRGLVEALEIAGAGPLQTGQFHLLGNRYTCGNASSR